MDRLVWDTIPQMPSSYHLEDEEYQEKINYVKQFLPKEAKNNDEMQVELFLLVYKINSALDNNDKNAFMELSNLYKYYKDKNNDV